jgi:hypothetical protein
MSECTVPSHILKPGHYFVTVKAFTDKVRVHEEHENVLSFDLSFSGYHMHQPRRGPISPVLDWKVRDAGTARTAGEAA